MNRWQRDVRDFHRRFGFFAPDGVTLLTTQQVRHRMDLVCEEYKEVVRSAHGAPHELAGELVDLVYVCLGTAVAMGVDLDPHWREVHRANMTKVRVSDTEKAQKPDGFRPPDHLGVVLRAVEREQTREVLTLHGVLVVLTTVFLVLVFLLFRL